MYRQCCLLPIPKFLLKIITLLLGLSLFSLVLLELMGAQGENTGCEIVGNRGNEAGESLLFNIIVHHLNFSDSYWFKLIKRRNSKGGEW